MSVRRTRRSQSSLPQIPSYRRRKTPHHPFTTTTRFQRGVTGRNPTPHPKSNPSTTDQRQNKSHTLSLRPPTANVYHAWKVETQLPFSLRRRDRRPLSQAGARLWRSTGPSFSGPSTIQKLQPRRKRGERLVVCRPTRLFLHGPCVQTKDLSTPVFPVRYLRLVPGVPEDLPLDPKPVCNVGV